MIRSGRHIVNWRGRCGDNASVAGALEAVIGSSHTTIIYQPAVVASAGGTPEEVEETLWNIIFNVIREDTFWNFCSSFTS